MKSFAIVLLLAATPTFAAEPNAWWVPAVAHASGSGGSLWRSDVAIRNLGSTSATVELRLHQSSGVAARSWEIAAGRQQVFEDVVALLASGDSSGSLEILSPAILSVRSRTYNQASTGTFGQGLDGVTLPSGIAEGESAGLGALEESTLFRTNLGFLNMGSATAQIDVTLIDSAGALVGTYRLPVPSGQLRQDSRPFANRFGRTDLRGGSATATIVSGGPVVAYASVVDNRTGDPTTIPMSPIGGCP